MLEKASDSQRTVAIVGYRQDWPAEFARLGESLRVVLGSRAIRIDHIGSTSVPGLAAKDVIDIQVTVLALDDDSLRRALESAGLVWRTEPLTDHRPPGPVLPDADLAKRMASAAPGDRRANVHIRVAGRFNQRYALLCRDYLRTHPAAADAYAEVKRNLAALFPHDSASYYAVKDPVFDVIMAGAEEWAGATNWEPGPSDS